MQELLVSQRGRRIQRLGLSEPQVVIGRQPDCDVVLDSQVVSRYHARLEQTDGSYQLVDTGSTNGVFFNGKRLAAPHKLRTGDEFHIADFALRFVQTAEADLTLPLDEFLGDVLHVDVASREAWVEPGRRLINLSRQEFDLLALLHGHKGEVLTHATIGEAVWGAVNLDGVSVAQYDDSLIQRLVSRIKSKLAESEITSTIVNVRGIGYRLE